MRPYLLLLAVGFVCGSPMYGYDLAGFQACIAWDGGTNGYSSVCTLNSGVWPVLSTLHIGRGGLTLLGTTNNAADVILQRTSALGYNPILTIDGTALTVTINWLTFDGNRQAVAVCDIDRSVADVELFNAGLATVQNVNFISAPWRALHLGGSLGSSTQASSVSLSNFGQGFNSQGITRSAPKTATRWFGIIFQGYGTGVWHNNIAYVGLAAVHPFSGDRQYIVGNQFQKNRYEQPDGISGGQIWIADQATNLSVADNLINGDFWTTTGKNTGNTDILCTPNTGLYTLGIEGSGDGHRYYNNAIIQNTGWGILLRPWSSTSTLNSNVISGYDPFCTGSCVFVPKYIENNAGCWSLYGCYGSGWPTSMGVAGVNVNNTVAGPGSGIGSVANLTLDHVRSRNNGRYGVSLYNVTGTPGFIDSVNGSNYACITGNPTNLTSSGSSSGYNSYTNLCP